MKFRHAATMFAPLPLGSMAAHGQPAVGEFPFTAAQFGKMPKDISQQ